MQFTSNASILYSLDYTESANGVDSQTPKKSTDGGTTWTNLAGWDSGDTAYSVFADPNSTTNLIVSDYDTIYFSNNSGATFTAKYTAPNDGSGAFVAGAFFDGSNIYVATNRGLLVSTNGGSSFAIQSLGGMTGVMFSFAGAKQGGTTRFFAVTLPFADVFPGVDIEDSNTDYQGIYSIDVGQSNWSAKTTGIPAGDFPSFVSMARNDINTAYVAGGGAADAPTVSKTTNGGASWSAVLNTTMNGNVATGWQGAGGDRRWSFGEYALDFEVDPTDSTHVAFTDLGYVHLTTNGGTSWQQAYVNPADQNPPGANTPTHKAYRGVGLEDTSATGSTGPTPTIFKRVTPTSSACTVPMAGSRGRSPPTTLAKTRFTASPGTSRTARSTRLVRAFTTSTRAHTSPTPRSTAARVCCSFQPTTARPGTRCTTSAIR